MTEKTPDINTGKYQEMKVGICQIESVPMDIKNNFANTIAQLESAGKQGADLAITPECVIHGYPNVTQKSVVAKLESSAYSIDHKNLRKISKLAKKFRMMIVVGFAEKDLSKEIIYNSAAVFDRQGDLIQTYRKVFLRPFENILHTGAYTAGNRFQVDPLTIDNKKYNIGTMICFDREITESARCLRSLNAQFIACPLACDTCDMTKPIEYADAQTITRVRAAENEVFIAVVNHSGRFNGGSFIVGPGGELLEQLGEEPEMRIVEVPIGIIPDKFHSVPLGWQGWGYRRPEVTQQYI